MPDLFEKMYQKAKRREPCVKTLQKRLHNKGAIWRHKDGRALASEGLEFKIVPSKMFDQMLNDGLVQKNECPMSHNVDIYFLTRK